MPFDIKAVQRELDQRFAKLAVGNHPIELYEPIRYILSVGGKRMRPVLTLLGCHLYSDDFSAAFEPAMAVEVFHNFTLMHDDIMDKAPLRRGLPTVHEKWNGNTAILSGDVMLIKAYDLLLDVRPEVLRQVIFLFNKCAAEVCEGQQLDMNFETLSTVQIEGYLEMIRLKTAVLLGFSLQLGALIGGAPARDQELIRGFGENIGIGFQLKDDLLDVYGDKEKFGKQVGGDIIANKKTFLLLKSQEDGDPDSLEKLNYWLDQKNFDPGQKVKEVKGIFDKLAIQKKTEEQINFYFHKAFDAIDALDIPQPKKHLLKEFAETLINREK